MAGSLTGPGDLPAERFRTAPQGLLHVLVLVLKSEGGDAIVSPPSFCLRWGALPAVLSVYLRSVQVVC